MRRAIPGILALCALSISASPEAAPKAFRDVRAVVDNGAVVLTAFKAQRYIDEKSRSLFDAIRIYRLACPDFAFGKDYAEYFSGLDPRKAELVFRGKIEPQNDFKFRFVDKSAKAGEVYAYWIATTPGEPLGPMPVKVRDPNVWWTSDSVAARLEALKGRYPGEVVLESLGAGGRPLLAVRVGRGKAGLALVGAVHAGEAGAELIIPILERLLERRRDLLDKISVAAIPSVNGGMRDRLARGNPWYLRRSTNLVDLNRNYPADWETVDSTYGYLTSDPDGETYRGPFAGSEPETAAVTGFLEKFRPRAVFSFHCLAALCGETLLASKAAAADAAYIGRCYDFAKTYWREAAAPLSGEPKIAFECSSGSLPAWCYRVLGIPGFDMEAPFDARDTAQCVADMTDVPLLEKYREKHFRGFAALLEALADRMP